MPHAYVTGSFRDAGQEATFKRGDVLLDLSDGQFEAFKGIGKVRLATDEEAAKAQAAQDAPRAPTRTTRRPSKRR